MVQEIHKRILYSFTAIVFIVLFILPFVYLVHFIPLATDDFCRVASSSTNYFEVVKDWYLYLNGRYINALITSIPIVDSSIGIILLYAQFLAMGFLLYLFTRQVMIYYKLQIKDYRSFFLSVLLYVTVIAKAPSLYELFYWYSAVTVYLFSFLLFLIFLVAILKPMMGYKAPLVLIGVTAVFLNGNNELFIGITNFLLLLLLLKEYLQNKVLKPSYLFLNLLGWISSAAFVFAPGSTNRQQQFDYGGDFIGSIKVAVFYGGKYILENLLDPTNFLFYLLTFLIVYRFSPAKNQKILKPFYLLAASLICMVSMFFIVYYATGLFDVRTGRIGNTVGMVLQIFIFLNVLNLAVFLKTKNYISYLSSSYVRFIVMLGFVASLLFTNKNYADVRSDFANRSFERFQDDLRKRDSILKYSEEKRIVLKPIEGTLLLKSGDAYLEQEESMKGCYIKYINKKYNKNYKEIIIHDL